MHRHLRVLVVLCCSSALSDYQMQLGDDDVRLLRPDPAADESPALDCPDCALVSLDAKPARLRTGISILTTMLKTNYTRLPGNVTEYKGPRASGS